MPCSCACFFLNYRKQHNSNTACLCITDNVDGRISVINVLYTNAVFGRYNVSVTSLAMEAGLLVCVFFPLICQTQGHTHFCRHTLVPLNIHHIPLIMKPGSLRELEGSWRNWGQNDFEDTSWSSIGHGIFYRARIFWWSGTSVGRWKRQDFKCYFQL